MNTDAKNAKFEKALIDACIENLRDHIDPYHYADVTLNQLWLNGSYESPGGTAYYFEIPARDTKFKRPHVVTI